MKMGSRRCRHSLKRKFSREQAPRKKSIQTDVSTSIRKSSLSHLSQVPLPPDFAFKVQNPFGFFPADEFTQSEMDQLLLCPFFEQSHAFLDQFFVQLDIGSVHEFPPISDTQRYNNCVYQINRHWQELWKGRKGVFSQPREKEMPVRRDRLRREHDYERGPKLYVDALHV